MKKRNKTLTVLIRVAQISAVLLICILLVMIFPKKGANSQNNGKNNGRNWQDWLMKHQLHSVVYAYDGDFDEDGIRSAEPLAVLEPDINPQDAVVTVRVNDAQTVASLEIEGISRVFGVETAVWSETDGQDDLHWYEAKLENGLFKVEIPIKNHHTAGNYVIDIYVKRSDSSTYGIARSGFVIKAPQLGGVSFEAINGNAGTFDIKVTGAAASNSLEKAEVEVWSDADKKNRHVYQAEIGADKTAIVHGNLSNHNYQGGTYYAVATVTDANGIKSNSLMACADILTRAVSLSQSLNDTQTECHLEINNLIENSISQLEFEVYSKGGGKDDLVVYAGEKKDASSFIGKAVIAKHHTAGEYQVDAYGMRSDGKRLLLGTTGFRVDGPSSSGLSVQEKNEDEEYFRMRLSGVNSASGIAQVRFVVTRLSDNSQADYNGTLAAGDIYELLDDVRAQTESVDVYRVHAYVKDNNGIEADAGTQEVSMALLSNGKYKIMGQTRTSVSQMVKFFQARSSYPAFYAGSDAPSINAFCQIYIEECEKEGVRAEVAFCQAMKETGYLTFGGDVSLSQYNFGGIGATGNGEAGSSFASVREGIRAQVQHLKAYACTDRLNQPCVDPRFGYVKRGTAAYVEILGIRENPNGGGWAADANYGPSIVNDYIRKLFSY